MRIDYVLLDASARGGIARSTFTMAKALTDLGHDVRVVALVPRSARPRSALARQRHDLDAPASSSRSRPGWMVAPGRGRVRQIGAFTPAPQ
jgi:hypothetical protein